MPNFLAVAARLVNVSQALTPSGVRGPKLTSRLRTRWRVETAGLVAAAAILYQLGDLGRGPKGYPETQQSGSPFPWHIDHWGQTTSLLQVGDVPHGNNHPHAYPRRDRRPWIPSQPEGRGRCQRGRCRSSILLAE